ncbi:ABC-F family ATP-binding cassette domain-containing protein [Halobacillus litoralis]|uniref:ribosomal protection-like ABC-F family protein n=1 Tax=Halobacillus litoralis TaxID=45668 RepID=UPI001CFCC7B0|nr:ABC-F family ATP-binding cassette domain-containing protein [Halobacillus litoralis]WLR48188.1 ABC-F family ATP-binding cassette domain-containing protein [Halobacillus litoralis]
MIITLKNIYKIVGGEVLFEALDMEIKSGQRVGLVGRNGSGKSTLFRIITKEEALDDGDLFIQKGATIGYLKQIPSDWTGTGREYLELAFTELVSLAEQMKELEEDMTNPDKMEKAIAAYGEIQERFTQRGGYEMDASIKQVAKGLNIHHLLDHSFSSLSGGEKTKLGLAKLLLEDPDVLLLDEPTNHLDLRAIEWLEAYLQAYDGTICVISHDRAFLDHIVTDIMDLESGEVDTYKGNYTAFEKQKEEKLLAEFHQYEEQQKKIKKMKEAIRRLRQWANEATPPNPKLFKKAKSMEKALERMEKIDKPVIDPKKMNLSLEADGRTGKDVFTIESLKKHYGSKTILNGIDLHVRYQDRIAVVGANGSGKSTLLKILLEKETPSGGKIKRAPSIKVGYLPQNPLQGADRDQRMIDHFRDHIRVTEGESRHRLAGFMFYGYDVFRKIRHLSGGEQMRLKLAIFMHQDIQVLILDEPTNHLDVESQEVLEEALNQFTGTVIGVSHDRHFLDQCFTHTAFLVDGKLHRYIGTYEETKEHWHALLEARSEEPVVKHKKTAKPETAPVKEKPTIDWEKEIGRLEQEISTIDQQMQNGEDVEKLMELQHRKDELEKDLESLYEHWMEAQC